MEIIFLPKILSATVIGRIWLTLNYFLETCIHWLLPAAVRAQTCHCSVFPRPWCQPVICRLIHSFSEQASISLGKGVLMPGTSVFLPLVHKCLVRSVTKLGPSFMKGHILGLWVYIRSFPFSSLYPPPFQGSTPTRPHCDPAQQTPAMEPGVLLVH